MVYQNPGAALNPSIRVGEQIAEMFSILGAGKDEALDRTRAMLAKVQISDPARVMRRYPHQLSGGMQQRAVIAMALAKDPTLLILDEPTTGLDATVEAEVLDLIASLRNEFGTSVLFISHNLGVIRKMCERVGVLYAGRLVEEGPTSTLLADPRHPYTVGLLRCIPRGGLRKDRDRLDTIPGYLPQLGAHLPGCVFADRCPIATEICHTDEPPFHGLGGGHSSRCHYHERAASIPHATPPPREAARTGANGSPAVVRLAHAAKTFRQEGQNVPGARRTSTSTSGSARRWVSSASRAAARRRSPVCCSGSRRPTPGSHRGARRRGAGARRRASATRSRSQPSRSSSRTPTRRSTGASRCGASSDGR